MGRKTRKQKTERPTTVSPEVWKLLSRKQRNEAATFGRRVDQARSRLYGLHSKTAPQTPPEPQIIRTTVDPNALPIIVGESAIDRYDRLLARQEAQHATVRSLLLTPGVPPWTSESPEGWPICASGLVFC